MRQHLQPRNSERDRSMASIKAAQGFLKEDFQAKDIYLTSLDDLVTKGKTRHPGSTSLNKQNRIGQITAAATAVIVLEIVVGVGMVE